MKNLPECLRPLIEQDHWLIWKWRGGSKVPYQAMRKAYASTTDPSTWSSYRRCRAVSQNVGFVLRGSGIGALDLDDCRDGDEIESWAHRLIERTNSYVEITPSGTGLRIIGLAEGEHVHAHRKMRRGKIEMYRDADRYITITGDQLGDCARLRNIDALIDELAPPHRRNDPPVKIDDRRHEWREVCRRIGGVIMMVQSPVDVGKRSDVIWKIAKTLQGRGATPSEVACVLRASRCWRDKHGDNEEALRKEVARVFR